MLSIQVETDSGTYLLDLYENDPVELKYRFTDISEVNKSVGSYSKTFRIPATGNNISCFGRLFSTNEVGGYNPKIKRKAVIKYNTAPLMNGFIQFKKAYIQKEVYSDFEIAFFGESVDLARTLGENKLADLDLSTYDHDMNYSNLTNSWAGSLYSGVIRYGLLDRGQQYNIVNPISESEPLLPQNFTPFIQVKQLVNEIFEQNGFILEGAFFNDQTELYTPVFKGGPVIVDTAPVQDSINVGLTANETFTASAVTEHLITGFSESAPFFDSGGNFDPSTDGYTPPVDGQYSFIYNAVIEWASTLTESADVNVIVRNITDGTNVYASQSVIIPDGGTHTFTGQVNLTLDSTKEYGLLVRVWSDAGTITVKGNNVLNGTYNSWIYILGSNQNFQTVNFNTAANMPDIKQIDYLLGLQKMFNLVFIADKVDPKKITVIPYNDYTASTSKDWTKKLDLDKDIAIYPTTDLQRNKYEFTYSEDKDFINKFYVDNANRVYGRYLIEDTENDFSTGKQEIKPPFGAYPLQYIPDTNLLVHKCHDENGEVLKDPLCKVVYWGGLQDATGLYVSNVGVGTVNEAEYPYFGHHNVPNPDAEDLDLNYGVEQPTYPIIASPYSNLFTTYWQDYVNQLYSADSRILEAHFKLDILDLSTFQFNDRIFIKDSYFRILELSAVVNDRSLAKVKLIKILESVRACEWLPHTTASNGAITFINSDGVTGAGSQACCKKFGYQYIDSVCYHQNSVILNNSDDTGKAFNTLTVATGSKAEERNLIQGRNLTSDYKDVLLFGNNGQAIAEGFHRAAGWWYENFGTGNEVNQIGKITLVYEGDFNSGDIVEPFIDGRKDNRLVIPDDSALGVDLKVSVITYSVASGNIVNAQFLVFSEVFLKIGGAASTKAGTGFVPPNRFTGTFGTSSKNVRLNVDTATDSTQHRIRILNFNVSNTNKTKIICELSYQMAKL